MDPLSREMEFHADAVAASVSGSAPLITSLRRLDVANLCYDTVLNYYNRWYRENKKGDNLYPAQIEVMKFFAEAHDLTVTNGLVQVTAASIAQHNKTRVVVKDQWASHPSTDDREEHLTKLSILSDIETESAWSLFNQPEALQRKVTGDLYTQLTFTDTPEQVDFNGFRSAYRAEMDRYQLDKRYKGFYDRRNITSFDIQTAVNEVSYSRSLDDVLTPETVGLSNLISGIEEDIQVLESIQDKKSGIKVFEFDGKKYSRRDSFGLVLSLKKELEKTKAELENADKNIFQYFYKCAQQQGKGEILCADYQKMFDSTKTRESSLEQLNQLLAPLQEIYQSNLTEQRAEAITFNLKRDETSLKEKMKSILEDKEFATCYTEADKKALEAYLQQARDYFSKHSGFNNDALTIFNEAVSIYSGILSDKQFEVKKQLLDNQLLTV